jgi:dienelactone hydrolase
MAQFSFVLLMSLTFSAFRDTFAYCMKQKQLYWQQQRHRAVLVSSSSITTMLRDTAWSDLNPESLVAAPCLIEQTLCVALNERPQFAKNVDYARSILDAWRESENDRDGQPLVNVEWKSVVYASRTQDSQENLYGHLIRRRRTDLPSFGSHELLPGVVFFHTGAGPHDIFLLWKASQLVQVLPCVVLIADIFADDSGWSWQSTEQDAARYHDMREQLMASRNGRDSVFRDRVISAIDTIGSLEYVDSNRLAALGWCFGGLVIAELARLCLTGIQCMATFHGVFGNIENDSDDDSLAPAQSEILICHGRHDPFVPETDLENALYVTFILLTMYYDRLLKNFFLIVRALFQKYRHITSLLQLDAKHGFTNPAQEWNENPAFAFHEPSATKAWKQTLVLLQRRIGAPRTA